MNKFAIGLAAFVSLGLIVPAFAQEKKDTKMPAANTVVHHHHHHHHHHMTVKPEPKPQ